MALSAAYRKTLELVYGGDALSRLDDGDDRAFYDRDRFVEHLDSAALAAVEGIVGSLIVEARPDILDLMAGPSSHLPAGLNAGRVVGLGLNRRELDANPRLTESMIHDLNRDPVLPFADASFDVVLNTVSVDYLTRPFEVFREAGRVLRPGGLLLVVASDRMFPEKAVKVWREASEPERVMIVEDYVAAAEAFAAPRVFVVKGRPRPADDRHAAVRGESDPVYAVWTERLGDRGDRPERVEPRLGDAEPALPPLSLEDTRRSAAARRCPYCGEGLLTWAVPQTPFTELDTDVLHVCFNDACPYLQRGWTAMARQGNVSASYRAALHPRAGFMALPVHSLRDLRSGIVE